jgi:mono/diheme cytochrome c family protein
MIQLSRALPILVIGLGLAALSVIFAGLQVTDDELVAASTVLTEIPEEAKQLKNPFATDAESVTRGEEIFSSQCTMCHGADGRGTGDLVERLQLKIPDFTDSKMQAKWTDGALFYVVTKGHGKMPGQEGRFDDKRNWDLVNCVRSFGHGDS